MTFTHVKPGDVVTRMLAGTVPMQLRVTGVVDGVIQCGAPPDGWTFDAEIGVEIDDYLQWGSQYGKTGSYLVEASNDDGE